MLGGLYSSTATTVVLARQAKADPSMPAARARRNHACHAASICASLAVVAVFNLALAGTLAPSLVGLFALGAAIAAVQYRAPPLAEAVRREVACATARAWHGRALRRALRDRLDRLCLGREGFRHDRHLYLAAIVGVSHIDPFVLNLAQGGVAGMPLPTLGSAILIAAASNNVLKVGYAIAFAGWRASLPSVASLAFLAAASLAIAVLPRTALMGQAALALPASPSKARASGCAIR